MFPGVEKYFLKFYRKKEQNKFYVFSLLSEKERNGTWVQHCTLHLYIAMSSLTMYSFTVHSCSQWDNDGYTSILSQFQRSGAECFWQWWEHCNFSSHSIFSCSAPLRANHSQSNGAERNAFDSDGNIAISRAIQYFPAPLRSVPIIHSSNGAERNAFCHNGNMRRINLSNAF